MLRSIGVGISVVVILAFNGCASALGELNRRPFADNVALIAFKSDGLAKAKSIGNVEKEVCNKLWLGFIGDQPKYSDVKKAILKEHKVAYIRNVSSLEYAEGAFLGPNYCITLKGEGFR